MSRKCETYFSNYTLFKQNSTEKWMSDYMLPLPKNETSESKIRCITLTAIAAKVYSALFLNRIWSEIENFFQKYENASTTLQIITIPQIIEWVRAKNLWATLLLVIFSKHSISYTEERWSKHHLHMVFQKEILI